MLANVDGDTLHARVDLGCDVRIDLVLRFAGINAPELPSVEGLAAAQFVKDHLPMGTITTIRTAKDRREKFGRYLAWVMMPEAPGTWINQVLVDQGLAVPYGNLPVSPPAS